MSEVTLEDVNTLYDGASSKRRAILAQKIGLDINGGELSDTEYHLAVAICQKLAEDADVSVRQALSDTVKASSEIPKELAVQLASDVLEVSLPVLQMNLLLDDNDLLKIVHEGDSAKQVAITRRSTLSAPLSHTLAEVGDEDVVDSLLKNKGAEVVEVTFNVMLDRFEESERIHSGIVMRDSLPSAVVEKLVDVVGDQLKSHLLSNYELPPLLLEKMILESKGDAQNRLMTNPSFKRDAEVLVNGLYKQNKLTPELIVRALEMGDRSFFEHSLAAKASIPVENVRVLIRDEGKKGFAALYRKSQLPKGDQEYIAYLVDAEYNSKRNQPRSNMIGKQSEDKGDWVSETNKPKNRWRLF